MSASERGTRANPAPDVDIDLFSYPDGPGFKERTTSREAARAIGGKVERIRERVFRAIAAAGSHGMTPDEVAVELGITVLSARPRVSELALADPRRIVDTGKRRLNESGMKAKVWRAA